jgi:hypothetical protein
MKLSSQMSAVMSILPMSLMRTCMHSVMLRIDSTTLTEGIIDHKTDGHAVDRADMYIKHGSNTQERKTTKG